MPESSRFEFAVDDELVGRSRVMTIERVVWDGMGRLSAATGEHRPVQMNIHTDEAYAKSHGLPGIVADGMHSANWLSAMLTDYFGLHYVLRGALRTRFIRPVFLDVTLTPRGVVTAREDTSVDLTRYGLEVWCEDDLGERLTVGQASVVVDRADEIASASVVRGGVR